MWRAMAVRSTFELVALYCLTAGVRAYAQQQPNAGSWSFVDVTVVTTDFATSIGRNFTLCGSLWVGDHNATGQYHPQPSWTSGGPTLGTHGGRPLPFVTLKHWSPEADFKMGFSITAVGHNGAEELVVESELTPWEDGETWLACSDDGEDVFVDLAWDGVYRQVDCGVEGTKVRLGFQFAHGDRYDSSVVTGRPELTAAA